MDSSIGLVILVTGDRSWDNTRRIRDILQRYRPIKLLIHGDCRGTDKLADRIARRNNIPVKPYPANWNDGLKAGPLRNKQMLDENPNIDLVLAFHNNIAQSKGTKNMIDQARERMLKVILFTETTEYEYSSKDKEI